MYYKNEKNKNNKNNTDMVFSQKVKLTLCVKQYYVQKSTGVFNVAMSFVSIWLSAITERRYSHKKLN